MGLISGDNVRFSNVPFGGFSKHTEVGCQDVMFDGKGGSSLSTIQFDKVMITYEDIESIGFRS